MSKHTPEPWTYIATPESGISDYVVKIGRNRIHIFEQADARLIAAAPQMLEALCKFWRAERLNDEQYAEALRAADAAIIAATRETK